MFEREIIVTEMGEKIPRQFTFEKVAAIVSKTRAFRLFNSLLPIPERTLKTLEANSDWAIALREIDKDFRKGSIKGTVVKSRPFQINWNSEYSVEFIRNYIKPKTNGN